MSIARLLREIPISPPEFAAFQKLIREAAGIHLSDDRAALLTARLRRRLIQLDLSGYGEYLRRVLADASGAELEILIDAITTHVTAFRREPAHFDHLAAQALPALLAGGGRGGGELRLWCAGCATGQEAWSLVMAALPVVERHPGWRLRVTATDICRQALATAAAGVYPETQLEPVPRALRARFFEPVPRPPGEEPAQRVKAPYRSLVAFQRANLIDPPPVSQLQHVVMCRNVMIYFDRAVQRRVVENLLGALAPRGYLYVGHSESLAEPGRRLRTLIPACYQK